MKAARTITRSRAAAFGAAVALAAATCGASAPPADAALAFAPCAEPQQRGWECATLIAPLDHSGAVPGSVELRVQRLAHDGPPRAKALVNVEGGPGASTTARSAQTRRLLEGPTTRNGYELVLVDVRATGASRPHAIALGTSRFYSTADTVRDLELVRAGLGVERLALMGTSYSTLTAAEFARTFPERTDRIVLDSPLGPGGPDRFGAVSAAAALPALADVCRRAACPGGPDALADDLARVLGRLRRGLFWIPSPFVWRRAGGLRREAARLGMRMRTLLAILTNADENTARFAQLPVALHDAARGDWRALGREVRGSAARESTPPINPDLNRITRCLDTRVPWPFEAPAGERPAAVARLQQATVPTASLKPWGAGALVDSPLAGCSEFGPSGLPTAIKGGPIPAVPGVILNGAWDLRTPPADARALKAVWPSGTLVTAPATGHGVLRSATACATAAVDALLAGRAVDPQVCAGVAPVAQPLLVGAAAADPSALPGAPRAVGATASAVLATLRDAEVAIAVGAPRGGTTQVVGVVAGWVEGRRTPPSPAARLRLTRYALREGLTLDGTLDAGSAGGYRADVRLGGRHSGRVKIANGRLRGTIDGTAVDVRLRGALARAAVSRFG